MPKEETTKKPSPKVIKKADEKMQLWKPKKSGETVEGKLIGISESQFGRVLRIKEKKRVISVPVTTFLSEIPFEDFANENLKFVYKGVVGKNNMKVFDVFHLEDVPF